MSETKMTPERLAEIRGRVNAALPGPWHWSGFAKHPRVGSPRIALVTSHSGQKYIISADRDDGLMVQRPGELCLLAPAVEVAECQEHNGVITGMKDPNATLIANAPTDLYDLLAEHDRLTAQLAEARAEAAGYRDVLETYERGGGWSGHLAQKALSTPPSHYAKRVELMEKVVEGIRLMVWPKDFGPSSQVEDALTDLEAHEREGGGR